VIVGVTYPLLNGYRIDDMLAIDTRASTIQNTIDHDRTSCWHAESRGYKFPLLFVPYFFTSIIRAIICVNGEYVSSEKSQIDAKRVIFIINVSAMRAIIGLESSKTRKTRLSSCKCKKIHPRVAA